MRIFYQGQLDFFCAAYAVLNALALVNGLPLAKARNLFAATLTDISSDARLWQATLRNETDFYWLVNHMLAGVQKEFSLRVWRPFVPESTTVSGLQTSLHDAPLQAQERIAGVNAADTPDLGTVWQTLQSWLPNGKESTTPGRAVILRFHRYLSLGGLPVISHWSSGARVLGGMLMLHDASKEEGALHSLVRGELATRKREISEARPLLLEPESLFFLERVS